MESPASFEVPAEARHIDLDLYSRQYYVYGGKAMTRLAEANVFLSGLSGLGIEIAKNIALAGVNSLTLHDPQPASHLDLSTQFFLSEEDVGKNRAEVVAQKIRELNAYVKIDIFTGDINAHPVEYFKQYRCVVLTDVSLETQLRINDYCHKENIAFVSADVRGLFCWAFCDFGDKFEIHDKNGEEPVEVMIEKITKENPGIVTTLDKASHGLEDGTLLSFREIKGMTELNESNRVVEVKVINASTFSIGDTSSFSPYQSGGIATEVKKTIHMGFLPLREALEQGEFVITDWAKMDNSANLHIGMQALQLFKQANQGQLPRPWNKDDADAFVKLCAEVNSKTKLKAEPLNESLLRTLSHTSRGSVVGLTAFMGGVVAQEAVKACTGKFSPLHQWLYFDAIEVLPRLEEGQEHDPENFQPSGGRYDAQIICLGKKLSEKVSNLSLFMVGSGAIGCEMLKNFAMLGVSAGSDGRIIVTDNDVIEKSNLNRQFLFRNHDIQQPKSTTAAKAALSMNKDLHIESHLKKVGTESEDIYTDHFFRSLDMVVNALDNINARLYVDQRCVTNQRALLESGTLGTKGHVQVIVPFMTESYGSRRDPPEKDVPFCTLKSFPNQIEHCIQWARDKFETNFNLQPTEHNKSVEDVKDFIQKLRESGGGDRLIRAAKAVKYIEHRPQSFDDCISWARITFEKNYPNKIKQLLHSFPLDQVTPEGGLFWSGAKRPPVVFEFDATNSLHIDYIRYAAALRAKVWGITPEHVDPRSEADNAYLAKICAGTTVPPFKPRDNKVIETDTTKKKEQVEAAKEEAIVEEFDEAKFTETLDKLAALVAANPAGRLVTRPEEFEKDLDSNFHIDFITATSNLRAASYAIASADRLKTKRIAGRIMPAIATTTAAVSGLVSLELIKLADKRDKMEDYKNAFLNLGLPAFQLAEPSPAEKTVITPSVSITLWDSWEIKLGDITLQQFVDHFKSKYNLTVTGVFMGVQMVYVPIMPGHAKRLPLKLRRVLMSTAPADVKGQKYVDLIVTFEDVDGSDVNGPAVRFWLVAKRRKAAAAKATA